LITDYAIISDADSAIFTLAIDTPFHLRQLPFIRVDFFFDFGWLSRLAFAFTFSLRH